jgi:hypothetical protein
MLQIIEAVEAELADEAQTFLLAGEVMAQNILRAAHGDFEARWKAPGESEISAWIEHADRFTANLMERDPDWLGSDQPPSEVGVGRRGGCQVGHPCSRYRRVSLSGFTPHRPRARSRTWRLA